MKFYSEEKELSVFHKRKKIANFTDGEFETDNPDVIERLKTKFRFESSQIISSLAVFLKLKKEAISKGIYKKGMKKVDLIEALKKEKK